MPWAQAALAPGAAAQIITVEGRGEQRAASASDWRPAQAAAFLAAGDFVRTQEAARMALLLGDETQLRLHQHSVLQIKALAGAGQGQTQLRLESGRAWAQTRRPPSSTLELQTPSATAAIRGTDWDIRVEPDGRTLLTVFSGQVQLRNDLGEVMVGPDEAAVAEIGKPPIKLHLQQPRARVQWVNALQANALPSLRAMPPPQALAPVVQALAAHDVPAARQALAQAAPETSAAWRAVLASAIDIQSGAIAQARAALDGLAQQHPHSDALPLVALLRSDLLLVDGDSAGAVALLQAALAQHPGEPALLAQLARAQLLLDDLQAAEATLAQAEASSGAPANVDVTLARAALARHEGDSEATLAAYRRASTLAAQDPRGWLGLGSSLAEREDSAPAHLALARALALDPDTPTLQGEIATLATLDNDFAQAQAAFDAALAAHSGDYMALNGLGLLRLKQGQPEAALDAFLRAGVLQPRYARAKTWTAVAYYQLGRHRDAIATLAQASALDDKDPVPYMLLAQIHTDLFAPGEAVTAAREAVARMPYLKSLNQLANDQKGSANLGASLAFFGLEDWAMELAQQSFYPYWAGSHFFLAERQRGEFARNSALFQGFLTDPLAFGASQRHASLLQQPGSHGALTLSEHKQFYRLHAPSVVLNGMDNQKMPVAWFLKAHHLASHDFPIGIGSVGKATFFDPTGRLHGNMQALTWGLGMAPSARLKGFAYGNHIQMKLGANNALGSGTHNKNFTATMGLSYRWSPQAQTWFKVGRFTDAPSMENYPSFFDIGSLSGLLGLEGTARKQFTEVQWRHSEDASSTTRWALSLEYVRERQNNRFQGFGEVQGLQGPDLPITDTLYIVANNRIQRSASTVGLDIQHRLSPQLDTQGSLIWHSMTQRAQGAVGNGLVNMGMESIDRIQRDEHSTDLRPSLGLVWQPWAGSSLRMAYQAWQRPLGTSTFTSTQTAGIGVEDRLIEAGGHYRRHVLQWSQSLGAASFISLRADHLRLFNPLSLGVDSHTPSLPLLNLLRNDQVLNLSTADLLEASPSFVQGQLSSLSGSVNHIASGQLSLYAKYQYQRSRSQDPNAQPPITGLVLPYIPRHTLALGGTWISPQRWYVSARAVYRSARYEDTANLSLRPAGWQLDLRGFWESQDKRWLLGLAALNLGGAKNARQTQLYILEARYRF